MLIAATVAVVVLGVAGFAAWRALSPKLPIHLGSACVVEADGQVTLDLDQMANAATIAAVGIRGGVPERGVIIALATALQESKLRNLTGGDRDSVGLFQQRPSQGWVTPAQINDPRYAAGRLYSALVRVRGWQDMRVTDAAQAVQRSAHPELYQQWEPKATVLTKALVGAASGAVACTPAGAPPQHGAAAAAALDTGLRRDWGDDLT